MRGRDLTTGAIPAHTWALAWPVMLSIFFQTMYQAVDAFWVSQLADEALAAVSMSQIALFAAVSLTIGITVGSGVLMAMSIGARAVDEAERILGQSFVLNFIAAVVLTALVLALRTPILRAVGATDAIFPLAKDYLTITASAMVLMFLFFAAVFGFNSQGDNTTVPVLFAISTALNIVLDPLLIFGWLGFPRLGVRGAAIATVISQFVLLVSGITLLATRDMLVRLRFRRLVIRGDSVARVLAIGVPASLTSLMGPLLMATLTAVVARAFGDHGAIAMSVGFRAEVFSLLPAIGFGVAGLALIGQNMGAGNLGAGAPVVPHRPRFRAGVRFRDRHPGGGVLGPHRAHLHRRSGGDRLRAPLPAQRPLVLRGDGRRHGGDHELPGHAPVVARRGDLGTAACDPVGFGDPAGRGPGRADRDRLAVGDPGERGVRDGRLPCLRAPVRPSRAAPRTAEAPCSRPR